MTMILLVVAVLGIVSIRRLPVSLIPDVDIPYITVQVTAPDLSAREIDETVSRPLRQQLIQTSFLEDITSESVDGSCTIRLSFSHGSDMDYLFIEVNEKIDRTMDRLKDIDRPKVFKSDATDIPVFYINMTLKEDLPLHENADRDLFPVSDRFSDMSRFAEEVVSKRLEQLEEVAMVDLSGYVDPEILIIPDEKALRSLGIPEDSFASLIEEANIRLGSLSIRDGEYRYNVKFQSFASDKKDIEDIYINVSGRLLQVKDIAQVIEHPAKRSGLVRSDGKDAVTMAVIKQSDARMADLRKSVGNLVSRFSRDYPQVEFTVTRDQTELLKYSIDNLALNIIAGIILACLIIFLFMRDFKSPALVALTIPSALIFSMLIFYAAGLTINIISLSGLIIGVGMMVDNTIILTDNITARWLRGENLKQAVVRGTREVTGAMFSSVLTTCAVFIPLVFLSGTAGALFHDQALAVTIVLMTSYIVTVTIIPVYYWCWYKRQPAFRPSALLEKFSFDRAEKWYEGGLKWLFRHRWVGWTVFSLSATGSAACLVWMPKEKLPEITYTDTVLKVDWNSQISLAENERRTGEIEDAARKYADHITSLVGTQQFVLGHSGEQAVSGTSLYMKCSDAGSLGNLKKDISSFLDKAYPSSLYGFENSGNIFDVVFASREADIVARLRPLAAPEIEPEQITSLVGKLAAAFPDAGIQEVPLKKDLVYVADPEKMALYGVTYQDIMTVLKNSINENGLFDIVQGSSTLPVVLGTGVMDIESIVGKSSVKKDGYEIPLNAITVQTYGSDLKYIVSGKEGSYYPVEMHYQGNNPSGLMDGVQSVVHDDGNFDVAFGGAWFSNRKMTGEMTVVLLIALALLYLILASQFESLLQPLIIMSEIVIDIFGALAVLWISGVSVNLMSLIGLVVICGIVINDSILKIDTINKLRKAGKPLLRAIMEAGQRRLKAIVMTSLTTILSVCPFLARGSMGDDLQYPMSLVIIAGMITGTVVSLFFVPALYYEIYRRKEVSE